MLQLLSGSEYFPSVVQIRYHSRDLTFKPCKCNVISSPSTVTVMFWGLPGLRCSQSSVLLPGSERRGAVLPGGGADPAAALSPGPGQCQTSAASSTAESAAVCQHTCTSAAVCQHTCTSAAATVQMSTAQFSSS